MVHDVPLKKRKATLGARRCLGYDNETEERCVESCRTPFCRKPRCRRQWYGLKPRAANSTSKLSLSACPQHLWDLASDHLRTAQNAEETVGAAQHLAELQDDAHNAGAAAEEAEAYLYPQQQPYEEAANEGALVPYAPLVDMDVD